MGTKNGTKNINVWMATESKQVTDKADPR